MNWQPIETAPKTSLSRLVYCPERLNTYMVRWDKEDEVWVHVGANYMLREDPTHWMPLPEPPDSKGDQPTSQEVDD